MNSNAIVRGLAATLLLATGCSAKAIGVGFPLDGATAPDVVIPPGVDVPPGVDAPPGVDVVLPDTPAPDDTPVGPPPAQTYDYVITQYVVDSAPGGRAPDPTTHAQGIAGFNLDGLHSTPSDSAMRNGPACGHADFFSTLDADQNMGMCFSGAARGGGSCQGGVDNQFPELANTFSGLGTDLRMSLNNGLSEGRGLLVVRVSEVNGTPGPGLNDNAVTVQVYPGARPMFANCSMIGQPGATYAVDDASLVSAGDLGSARIRFNARIVNGRLMTVPPAPGSPPNFQFALPAKSAGVPLDLHGTQLRFDLSADRGTNGNLGGYARLSALSSMLAAVAPAGIPVSAVQALLQSLVDVQDPAGNPMGCTAPNGGIAIGLGFSAVRALVSPRTVQGATPGTCGAP